jgi:hypothetical protein
MRTSKRGQQTDNGIPLSNAILGRLEKRANTLRVLLTLLSRCLEGCRSANSHKGSEKVGVLDWSASVIGG